MKKDKNKKIEPGVCEVVEENALIEIPSQYIVPVNPYDKMIELAITSDLGIDKLEKFLELQERFEKNEARKAYFAAFASFSENPPVITKSVPVRYQNTDGSWTSYSHADLGEALTIIKKHLAPHGISINFKQKQEEGKLTITCFLTHRLGYQESTFLSASPDSSGGKNGIQGIGSADSYLKRYTAFAITGVHAVGEDDDGQTAQPKPEVSSLVKLTPEYIALEKTKELFPELYQKAVEHFGGVPVTADTCKQVDTWIKSEVDKQE